MAHSHYGCVIGIFIHITRFIRCIINKLGKHAQLKALHCLPINAGQNGK